MRVSTIFAHQAHKAGDVIFREAPLLVGQHARSRAEALVCARCFRHLGSIESQLAHRLLLAEGAGGVALEGHNQTEHQAPNHSHSPSHSHCHSHSHSRSRSHDESGRQDPASCGGDHEPPRGAAAAAVAAAGGSATDAMTVEATGTSAGVDGIDRAAGDDSAVGASTSNPTGSARGSEPDEDEGRAGSESEGAECEEGGGTPEAIAAVQPQLRRLADGSERLPLTDRFPLPSPVPCRSGAHARGVHADGCCGRGTGTDGASGSGGTGGSSHSLGAPVEIGGRGGCEAGGQHGTDAPKRPTLPVGRDCSDSFCSTDCERAAWDSHGCLLSGGACEDGAGSSPGWVRLGESDLKLLNCVRTPQLVTVFRCCHGSSNLDAALL